MHAPLLYDDFTAGDHDSEADDLFRRLTNFEGTIEVLTRATDYVVEASREVICPILHSRTARLIDRRPQTSSVRAG